jgi:hypothetical protein
MEQRWPHFATDVGVLHELEPVRNAGGDKEVVLIPLSGLGWSGLVGCLRGSIDEAGVSRTGGSTVVLLGFWEGNLVE